MDMTSRSDNVQHWRNSKKFQSMSKEDRGWEVLKRAFGKEYVFTSLLYMSFGGHWLVPVALLLYRYILNWGRENRGAESSIFYAESSRPDLSFGHAT